MFSIYVLLCLCLFSSVEAAHDHISLKVWDQVKPYLLPEDHPIKPTLDRIFSASRIILSLESLEEAGFIKPKVRKWTHLIVTKHPKLPGYVVKTYLDAQRYHKETPEYIYWIQRVQGAQAIQELINKHHLEIHFKVPKKWIYALPDKPLCPDGYLSKNFILIEEDMGILNRKKNKAAWSSDLVNEQTLKDLHLILETIGLHDCAKIDNIPFATDGRIAFIDTQTCYEWPVPYNRLTSSLPKNLQSFWKKLTKD